MGLSQFPMGGSEHQSLPKMHRQTGNAQLLDTIQLQDLFLIVPSSNLLRLNLVLVMQITMSFVHVPTCRYEGRGMLGHNGCGVASGTVCRSFNGNSDGGCDSDIHRFFAVASRSKR